MSKEKNGSLFNSFLKAKKSDVHRLSEIKVILLQAEYHTPLTEHNVEDMHTENIHRRETLRHKQLGFFSCKIKLVFLFLALF